MDAYAGRQRRFPIVAIVFVLFVLCVTASQFWVTRFFPQISGLVQINPSLVFLDIPIQLPVPIDLILVPALFLLSYPIITFFYPSRPGVPFWRQSVHRVRAACMGLFALLLCILAGGLIYYLVQDKLSTQVKNGINSMGIIAEIHLPWPGYEKIHLQGSMILFVCFLIGLAICIRKIRKEPPAQLTREQRMTPYERMLQEKRLQKKQYRQEQWPVQEQQVVYHGQQRLCSNHPVFSLKPQAVSYMPM